MGVAMGEGAGEAALAGEVAASGEGVSAAAVGVAEGRVGGG